jgi:hypothetical protein
MSRVARFNLRHTLVTLYYDKIFLISIFRQSSVTITEYVYSTVNNTTLRALVAFVEASLARHLRFIPTKHPRKSRSASIPQIIPPQSTRSVTAAYRLPVLLALLSILVPSSAKTTVADRLPIVEALAWVRTAPRDIAQFDYVMTARVRILFFWAGKDDVGGGYIRMGISKSDPRQELLQVLFGSDPAKAPRAINRWGAGTEVIWHKDPAIHPSKIDDVTSTAFFGFMKSSKGKSVSEMQEELRKEKSGGEHQFTGILSRVETGRAISLIVPLASSQDYNLHQYAEAEPIMLEKLSTSDRPARILDNAPGCPRAGEFLGALLQLNDIAIEGGKAPESLCYVYDAEVDILTLEHLATIRKLDVRVNSSKGGTLTQNAYDELLQADFVSSNQTTGRRVNFTILLGTQGALRGVPVQIRYQPNWWFQIVLNLLPNTPQPAAPAQ